MKQNICDEPNQMLAQALNAIKEREGNSFDLNRVNLAELERQTGISRSKLRRLKRNRFVEKPHANKGRKFTNTVMEGYTGTVDNLLRQSVTNSEVIYSRIKDAGYCGSLTTVKNYISTHKDLIPAKREIISPQGNRGRRYQSGPGEMYQMDWGFVNVQAHDGVEYRCACFAMICHHCGKRFVEFFPNAKQENLFIGMIHAFVYMGVPQVVLTDNMKSVIIKRDSNGYPIWQKDYEAFMKSVGFTTKLCKPRHPFTKGSVERFVRFVKDNFIVGRFFGNLTDLNIEAMRWCEEQNCKYHRAVDCVPSKQHAKACMTTAKIFLLTDENKIYLYPLRRISFDGFINYEGRRFGVPYWYTQKTCRITRDGFYIMIYDTELTRKLATHNVTWSKKDSFCINQYVDNQPEELPTAPVKALLRQTKETVPNEGFRKFAFGEKVNWDE